MLNAGLEKKALKAKQIQERVFVMRHSPSLMNFLGYLYWRNRYPILTRILSRILLFIELYLLFKVFHLHVAASFTALFFSLYCLRSLFDGVQQYFRLHLIEWQQQHAVTRAADYLALLLRLAAGYGVIAGISFTVTCFLLALSGFAVSYAAVSALLLPLQLVTSGHWMAVYTQHRLPRRFSVVFACRLIPIAAILLGSTSLGPYAYVLGIFFGRSFENIYLLKLARIEARNAGLLEPTGSVSKLMRKIVRDKEFLLRSFFPLSYIASISALALSIYARGLDLWITHFSFYFVTLTVAYPALRVAQSLSMDIYLSLRAGDIEYAQAIRRKSRKATCVVLGALVILFTALMVSQTALFTLHGDVIYSLFVYFLLLLIVRSIYLSEMTIARAAGIESSYLVSHVALLVIAALPIYSYASLILRANLPLLYLLESALLISVIVWVLTHDRLSLSPIYLQSKKIRLDRRGTLSPVIWCQNLALQHASGKFFQHIAIQLDPELQGKTTERNFLLLLEKRLPRLSAPVQIVPGIFVFSVAGPVSPIHLSKQLRKNFGGHIKNIRCFAEPVSAEDIIASFFDALQLASQSRKTTRVLQEMLRRMLQKDYLKIIRNQLKSYSFSTLRGPEMYAALLNVFGNFDLLELPRIDFLPRERSHSGAITLAHLRASVSTGTSLFDQQMFFPPLTGSFALFSTAGVPLSILNRECVKDDSALDLRALQCAWIIASTEKFLLDSCQVQSQVHPISTPSTCAG